MYKVNRLVQLFVLLVLMLAFSSTSASAAMVRCRTDPIFRLSNGDIVTITLEIGTDAANVGSVTYLLHVPAGVTVKQVVYTDGGIGRKETYKVYQDSPAKTYTTDTVITTPKVGMVAVTAYSRLNGVTTKAASGYSGQHLIVTLVKP
jgi:hypothetical protein